MALGLLDLSIVTDRLLKQLSDCTAASRLWQEEPTEPAGTPSLATPGTRFTIHFTGLPPDVARAKSNCQLSLYLFHVAPDKFNRNTFPQGGRPRLIPEQPFALTLYYLLSAHSNDSYIEEQQAMSIAIKCFYDHPILTATVPPDSRIEEFTLTMEPESVDEIGRLWQSTTSPLRLSAVYRASVIFLEPEVVVRPPTKLVAKAEVKAYPETTISRVTVTIAGRATINGAGFVAAKTIVQFDGVAFVGTTTDPPAPGRARVVDSTTLDIQLPSGTLKGPHLLSVQIEDGEVSLFTLELLADVP